jgi:glucose/arabinose dehydrogenase
VRPTLAAALDVAAAEVVATGLEVPWGLAFEADGTALVSERETGRILRVSRDAEPVEVSRIDDLPSTGEGGLLGIAVHPVEGVYAYYDTGSESRIVRLEPGQGPAIILAGIPASPFHTGGRMAFGPDGRLYASVGDAQEGALAQDPGSLAGKIVRLEPDGSIPADNPDPGSPTWASGFRNVEGLAWDGAGRLWATEFGESAFDELNLVERGGNYGWPLHEGPGGDPRFVDPLQTWLPAEASPAGLAFANGSLWIAALRGERLWQVPLGATGRPADPVPWLEGVYGRLRTVELAPEGSLWLATSNRDGRGEPSTADDRLIRIPFAAE